MSTTHRSGLPPGLPNRMKSLPRDSRGWPLPFFTAVIDGKPDFRVIDPETVQACAQDHLCFTCGQRLPARGSGTFVVGPIGLMNRISGEPPSHLDCAEWSARACPFLANPGKERRVTAIPEATTELGGVHVMENPGVSAVITTQGWSIISDGRDGVLWKFDYISGVLWRAEGREASRSEVLAAFDISAERLLALDANPESVERRVREARKWLP